MNRLGVFLLVLLLVTLPLHADEGNGQGQAVIKHGPVQIGGTLTVEWGSPGLANAQGLFVVSDGLGPTSFQGIPFCIDVNSPGAQVVVDTPLDATGFASFSIGVPNLPSLTTIAPAYGQALVVDFSVSPPFTTSKAVAFHFENADGYSTTSGSLGTARALHTTTALAEDAFEQEVELLIAGGGGGNLLAPTATSTTELFSPVSRQFRPGPMMAVERALHRAVRLQNGQVLVIGGADNAGVCVTSCELYDPATEAFLPTGSMNQGRAGHAATLLGDGRVLVTGGLPSFDASTTPLDVLLNNALNDAEIYDPVAGTWTQVLGAMSDQRFGHAQEVLADGRVIITGGIDGASNFFGAIAPTYTSSCDFFDPATDLLSSAPSLSSPRGAHAISQLGNGDILVTGGIGAGFLGIPSFLTTCQRFDGLNWNSAGSLTTGVALHTQVPAFDNGDAIIIGGISGISGGIGGASLSFSVTDQAGRHDGASFTALSALGTNPGDATELARPRGSHTCTPLYDGTFALIGGADLLGALDSGLVYLEN